MKSSIALALVLVILGLASFLGVFAYPAYTAQSDRYVPAQQLQQPYPPGPYGNGYGGMMGGYGNGYGGMMGQGSVSDGQPVTIHQAEQLMRTVPSYARVIASNNTVVFDSQQISIFVLALMPDKAVNLTGKQMPSYATGDVFVIYGLINPTLVMRSGTWVQFTVVNLDDDMYHNLAVSSYGPPYGYTSMQGMMSDYWMPYLPPADYSQGSAHEYSYTMPLAQPGTFWYLCTYPDHAETGMYGTIIVTR